MILNKPQRMEVPVLADQLEFICMRSVQTQDLIWKPFLERVKIGTEEERESGKSVRSAWLDDIYIYIYIYEDH